MQDKKYDLIVVGSGILGTFHAYHALEAGLKVLLLEKDNYPVGATVRNFGQAVPSGMVDQWFRYGVRGLEVYQSIQKDFDITVRNNGSVYIASDKEEQQLIHELKNHYDTIGYSCELLSAASVLAKYPALRSSYVKEGLFFPQEVSVEPDQMIYKVHEYMQQQFNHFTLLYNAPVIGCENNAGGVHVKTTNGSTYLGEKVVICNGNEFKLLFPEMFRKSGQVVSKLQMLRTIQMPEVQLEGNILTGLTIRRYESFENYCPSFNTITTPDHYKELKKWGIHILFKKAVDGSFIIGDSHEYADANQLDDLGFKISDYINQLMLNEAERIASFDIRKISSSWVGYYPQHPDKNIVEIDISDNILIRTCIGGKGMTAGIGYTEHSVKKIFNL
ncbi:MAG TPA: TIGR03364 family FAD-dependent oxidoreductase [Pseudosphingobacterium sp.]|nr:TIGR03364 family FAD-dependent oxidoreductase [Pseudosphingobacterium sp.]